MCYGHVTSVMSYHLIIMNHFLMKFLYTVDYMTNNTNRRNMTNSVENKENKFKYRSNYNYCEVTITINLNI